MPIYKIVSEAQDAYTITYTMKSTDSDDIIPVLVPIRGFNAAGPLKMVNEKLFLGDIEISLPLRGTSAPFKLCPIWHEDDRRILGEAKPTDELKLSTCFLSAGSNAYDISYRRGRLADLWVEDSDGTDTQIPLSAVKDALKVHTLNRVIAEAFTEEIVKQETGKIINDVDFWNFIDKTAWTPQRRQDFVQYVGAAWLARMIGSKTNRMADMLNQFCAETQVGVVADALFKEYRWGSASSMLILVQKIDINKQDAILKAPTLVALVKEYVNNDTSKLEVLFRLSGIEETSLVDRCLIAWGYPSRSELASQVRISAQVTPGVFRAETPVYLKIDFQHPMRKKKQVFSEYQGDITMLVAQEVNQIDRDSLIVYINNKIQQNAAPLNLYKHAAIFLWEVYGKLYDANEAKVLMSTLSLLLDVLYIPGDQGVEESWTMIAYQATLKKLAKQADILKGHASPALQALGIALMTVGVAAVLACILVPTIPAFAGLYAAMLAFMGSGATLGTGMATGALGLVAGFQGHRLFKENKQQGPSKAVTALVMSANQGLSI